MEERKRYFQTEVWLSVETEKQPSCSAVSNGAAVPKGSGLPETAPSNTCKLPAGLPGFLGPVVAVSHVLCHLAHRRARPHLARRLIGTPIRRV